ncbi:MAG: hypothetical protein JXB17_11895 [Bacteroidales bacterium]|nr:hypothetical protein [Bacteroidales bacterium]
MKSKTIISLLIIIFINISFISHTKAAAPAKRKNSFRKYSWDRPGGSIASRNNKYGAITSFTFSQGITTGLEYAGVVGVQEAFDYRTASKFSFGLQANYYIGEPLGGYHFGANNKTPAIGLRAHYHLFKLSYRNFSPFDVYGGLSIGTYLGKGNDDKEDITFFISPQIGVKYQINRYFLVYAEGSMQCGSLGFGLVF